MLEQITTFACLLGVFLLFVLVFARKNRPRSNSWFLLLVGVLTLALAGRWGLNSVYFNGDFRFLALPEIALLLFGPVLYFFLQTSLTNQEVKWREWCFFLPMIAHLLFLLFAVILQTKEVATEAITSGRLMPMSLTFVGIGLLTNGFFWYRSYQLYQSTRKQLRQEYSHWVDSGFLGTFLYAVGAVLITWAVVYAFALQQQWYLDRWWNHVIWLSLSLLVFLLGFYVVSYPELFRVAQRKSPEKYRNSKLTSADIERLKKELDLLMESKRVYLQPKLLKQELSAVLGVSPPDLARILNEGFRMNFFEYVNYYRIQEFIRLAQTDEADRYTYLALAEQAGFNSKATFNRAFKQVTGKTPSGYFRHN